MQLSETLPNSAELSSLIYYASTRRTKLDKVGTFLIRKTRNDVSHKRLGHINVTLHILDELLSNCPEDVGVLSDYVLTILENVVSLNELSSHLMALNVFQTYCKTVHNDQIQVFGDAHLLNSFFKLCNHFFTCNGVNNNNNEDWKAIPITAAKEIANQIDPVIANYKPTHIKKSLTTQCITMLVDTLIRSQFNLDLIRVTSMSSSSNVHSQGEDINNDALLTLKAFYDTSSKSQLDACNSTLISYAIKNNVDIRWICRLFAITTKRTHIELRYRTVGLLLQNIEKGSPANNVYLGNIVEYLLSVDELQFFAVPVKDVISKLVEFQEKTVSLSSSSSSLSSDSYNNELKCIYVEIIKNLTRRIYYNGQINDMCFEILDRYSLLSTSYNVCDTIGAKNFSSFTKIVINDINEIFHVCQEPPIKAKMSPFAHDLFKRVYYTLDTLLEQVSHSQNSSAKQILNDMSIEWISFMQNFYEIHTQKNWKRVNYDGSATSNENVICYYIDLISRLVSSENDIHHLKSIVTTTIKFIEAVGVNFIINWWKFSKSWLEGSPNLHIMSLVIMKYSGITCAFDELTNFSDEHISNNDIPDWASVLKSESGNSNEKLTYEKLTSVLHSFSEISPYMDTILGNSMSSNFGLQMMSPPNLIFSNSNASTSGNALLSESNSIHSFKLEITRGHSRTESQGTMDTTLTEINNSMSRPSLLSINTHTPSVSSLIGRRNHSSTGAIRVGSGSTLDGLTTMGGYGNNMSRSIRLNLRKKDDTDSKIDKRSGLAFCISELDPSDAED